MRPPSLLALALMLLALIHAALSETRPGGKGSTALGSGEMFDAIAPRYDLINSFLSLGMHTWWRSRMVAALELQPGDTVLDCGTGTADVAITVARMLKRQGKRAGVDSLADDAVVGVDPSANMLERGRRKVAQAGFEAASVRLVQGDAQDLSKTLAADQRFDAATMAFAIRNVPDRLMALKSIASYLKPGARLAVLELGEPTFPPARWFVKYCVPLIGSVLSGGARAEYQHLERSVMKFNPKDFQDLIEQAGLDLVGVKMMNFGSVGLYLAQKPLQADAPASGGGAASTSTEPRSTLEEEAVEAGQPSEL